MEPSDAVQNSDVGAAATVPLASSHQQRDWHLAMLVVALTIIGLSFVLSVRNDQKVTLWGMPLPESCGMRMLFHCDCPACGLTRSFVHLAHGNLSSSIEVHRLGWLLAVAVLLQLPYRWFALRNPTLSLSRRVAIGIVGLLVALFLVNWVYQQVTGVTHFG